MSVRIERILTSQEFKELKQRGGTPIPGTAWEMNWYFDPARDAKRVLYNAQNREDILSGKKKDHFLSMHYWRDWSHLRPPICVICPNGQQWVIDQVSRDGPGWQVTGDFPMITCTPSIVLPGYHGTLIRGLFSADLEGRGPNGI